MSQVRVHSRSQWVLSENSVGFAAIVLSFHSRLQVSRTYLLLLFPGVDIEAATKAGVIVARIPGVASGNAPSCAEMAIYLILSLLRNQVRGLLVSFLFTSCFRLTSWVHLRTDEVRSLKEGQAFVRSAWIIVLDLVTWVTVSTTFLPLITFGQK